MLNASRCLHVTFSIFPFNTMPECVYMYIYVNLYYNSGIGYATLCHVWSTHSIACIGTLFQSCGRDKISLRWENANQSSHGWLNVYRPPLLKRSVTTTAAALFFYSTITWPLPSAATSMILLLLLIFFSKRAEKNKVKWKKQETVWGF